ncbi:MAG: methionine adenosyltransferase [Verrucomicrobiaceae bacterium]|nr:methionine adenosyltransferase [Verrucomicrobiaceae bacterium]
MKTGLFTSESVTEGHPDKVCDTIADAILDASLRRDPHARVACEVLCKDQHVILAGEIGSHEGPLSEDELDRIVRECVRSIGYVDPAERFHADGLRIQNLLGAQSCQIARAVVEGNELGAGDQGLMFGYASTETAEAMPLPITLAHRLSRQLAQDRKTGRIPWARPDAKTQVTVAYENGEPKEVKAVVVSTQHALNTDQSTILNYVRAVLIPDCLLQWAHDDITLHVNPSGSFTIGGPEGDCGVTGRKIIVDSYGGFARHGGGAFSGKDGTKVDRSGAYFARHAAKQVVKEGLASRCEVQVAYAIGVARPVSISVDTQGTGDEALAARFLRGFDFRPEAILESLNLRQPIFGQTTNYGHFGKTGLPWEA